MNHPKQGGSPLGTAGMLAGAMSAGMVGVSFTAGLSAPYTVGAKQGQPMTPHDQALLDAKIDLKLARQETDIKLNTQGLAELKQRFDDFAKRMDGVPTAVATITERVSHLPTKDELGTKLRNYMLLGVALIGLLLSVATFFLKFVPAGTGAAT